MRIERAFHTPQHPVAAIVGGAKISTKLELLGHLLVKFETLIIGGGMANTLPRRAGQDRRQIALRAGPDPVGARNSGESPIARARDRAAG